MPMLSRNLEKTLRRALAYANARQHEYATLEHLLMALTEDQETGDQIRRRVRERTSCSGNFGRSEGLELPRGHPWSNVPVPNSTESGLDGRS